jgi:hypothetical protein
LVCRLCWISCVLVRKLAHFITNQNSDNVHVI